MNQPLLDLIAFVAGAVAVLVDRRRAVLAASIAVALGLAPAAALYGGGGAVVVLLGAGAAAAVAGPLVGAVGARGGPGDGLDPLRPVGAHEGLFGPRSVRVAGCAVALVAGSWVSFNVPVGSIAAVQGALFPVAFIFLCGVLRLFLARNLTDLAVGVAVTAVAVGVGWLLRGGSDPLPAAAGVIAIAPVAVAMEAWLAARRRGDARVPTP
ncbi:MAG: hypothetical protein ABSC16_08335 [Candidatus Dormibacteria bacterium]|nr:hypothetical protein [Chloroflexota bacterium]HBV94422.1 hypothetical protein [Chloroflexota bacterium]